MGIKHKIDFTFWNKSGKSSFGLKRNQAKFLALIFIIAGLVLLIPLGVDDFINFFLAGLIFKILPSLGKLGALVLTYTFIPIGFILLGAWIYPYNTRGILNGHKNRIIKFLRSLIKKPERLFLLICFLIISTIIYLNIL